MAATPRQEASFLAAIRDEIEDVGPRLCFADWLEGRGDPRGEFLRVQCTLDRLDEDDPRQIELGAAEADLLGQYGETWQGDLPREIELRFVGGMISIKVEARVLAEHSVSRWIMAHRGWILEISLVEVDEESLGLAVAGGLLARVPTLRLRFTRTQTTASKTSVWGI